MNTSRPITTNMQKLSIQIGYVIAPFIALRVSRSCSMYSLARWSIWPIVPEASEAFISETNSESKTFGYCSRADENSVPDLTCSQIS